MVNKKIQKNKRGFVLLFAVVLSSIILTIALGLAKISFQEIVFGTSARSTNEAFFAADTAVECALYYDIGISISAFGVPSAQGDTSCAGTFVDLNNGSDTPDPSPWNFVLFPLGSGQACAKVTVTKTTVDPVTTQVLARGYSSGGSNTVDCSASNPNRVERELEVNY
ncbi:MAG: hypothetical protein AAB438_01085 [Patescibacteria group bacterium]